ncbi:MAG: hypothetical protein IJ455_01640 [Agathobacter sp.]|nr:hypothetical protein [Agathobacter sp.]
MNYIKIEGIQDAYPERIEGTSEWYYCKIAKNCFCDLYEVEEILQAGEVYEGMTCVLIHYPDGQVYYPFVTKENVYVEAPVFWDGVLYFLVVDFAEKTIQIVAFDTQDYEQKVVTEISLNEVQHCYNLMLDVAPVMLSYESENNVLEVIWPEKKSFKLGEHEALMFRDENKIYFSEWFEAPEPDYEYHEMVVVRDWETGEEIEHFDGQLCRMPNGDIWRL